MAAVIPAKLKSADVQRFATRAVQLAKFRPIIAYWCEYFILQQILGKQLHASDDECANYALQLMDKLEAFKAENTANDAIIDDVAAKAYVENFALETFTRADESQRSNSVTRQTADTFSAASVFLDLLSVWGKLEPEIASKSKFSKFHALRISKAIKAGEDPNATNPVIEPPVPVINLGDDTIDAELNNLDKPNDVGIYEPPSVESLPESAQPSRPGSTIQNNDMPAPQHSSATDHVSISNEHEISPVEVVEKADSRAGSVGGGYFPSVPESTSTSDHMTSINHTSQTGFSSVTPSDPANFYHTAAPSSLPSPNQSDFSSPDRQHRPTPHQMATQPPAMPMVTQAPSIMQQPSRPMHSGPPPGGYKNDDESVMAAQKHAKWAISALNFEDVNTAVKELRIALQSLGAG